MRAMQIQEDEISVVLPGMVDDLTSLIPGPLDTLEPPTLALYGYLLFRKHGKTHAESMAEIHRNLPADYFQVE